MTEIKKLSGVKTVIIEGMMGGPEGNTVDFRGEADELIYREIGIDDFYARNANILMMDNAMISFKPTTVCTIKKHQVGTMPPFKSVKCSVEEPLPKSQKKLFEEP